MNIQLDLVEKRMELAGMPMTEIQKELSFAKQIYNRDLQLQKATPESIMSAIINVANVGLTLNPAASQAYLLTRWNGKYKRLECQLMPSYIGLTKLIIRESEVIDINSQVVHANDNFEINLADNRNPIVHKPDMFSDRGDIVGCYSIATLKDGLRHAELMSLKDIEEIMEYSDAYQSDVKNKTKYSPWTTRKSEMMRKTVLRRLIKYLPRGKSESELNNALQLEEAEYMATNGQLSMIESLLADVSLEPEQVVSIEHSIADGLTKTEASKMIAYLKENQLPLTPAYGKALNVTQTGKAVSAAVDRPNT